MRRLTCQEHIAAMEAWFDKHRPLDSYPRPNAYFIVELLGGPFDGKVFDGRKDGEKTFVELYLEDSRYRVEQKIESGNSRYYQLKYVGEQQFPHDSNTGTTVYVPKSI